MPFIDHVLEPPSYGWQNENGELIKPSPRQLFSEFFSRINIFKSKKNWLALTSWLWAIGLLPFFGFFVFKYANIWLVALCIFYAMVIMSLHGITWYHRYCTHHAYKFSNAFWRVVTQNLVVKVIPEEIYVVSHHVHHSKSDQPGDPYNSYGGFLYCYLADANHQPIARDLSEKDYTRVTNFLRHTGITINSYEQYQKWGSVSNPLYTTIGLLLNWTFWFGVFYLIGGYALVCTLFTGALIWALGVRTFNYNGHGKGKNKRREGIDYNNSDLSINQFRTGVLSGEWHNNHHLFPASARSGFLPYQIDIPWLYIRFLYKIGAVTSYHDSKQQFYDQYYIPYQQKSKNRS